jgi:hypothetical protein
MPVFEITTTKYLGPANKYRWTNNYNVNATNILDAQDYADSIADIEAAVLWDNVAIRNIEVIQVGATAGSRRNVYVPGLRVDADPLVQLPIFNTVLVRLLAATGRPSLKYFRCPLVEVEVEGFELTDDFLSFFDSSYSGPLVSLGALCNQDGQAIIGYETPKPVQNRQLGWHRRTRPGFHRGYVPN